MKNNFTKYVTFYIKTRKCLVRTHLFTTQASTKPATRRNPVVDQHVGQKTKKQQSQLLTKVLLSVKYVKEHYSDLKTCM